MLRNLSVVALASALAAGVASAAPSCMTLKEARAVYPHDHLYWHGKGRCWDNQGRRSRKRYRDPVFPKVAGPPSATPSPMADNFRPMFFVPETDVLLRFIPWEQRIVGTFQR